MGIKRSPTETLLKALEEFGVDEPTEVIVVFSTQGGDICTMCSTDVVSTKVGLLETAKWWQLNKEE
jgi:ATP-dependent Clp protease adapter protein ClpS